MWYCPAQTSSVSAKGIASSRHGERKKTHVRAVDDQRGAGDVGGRGREQERRRRGNLFDPPVPLQRDLLDVLLQVLLQQKHGVQRCLVGEHSSHSGSGNASRERSGRTLGISRSMPSVPAIGPGAMHCSEKQNTLAS